MNKNEANPTEEYAALIGLDWASEKHDVWLWDVATGKSRHRVIEHTPEALADWLSGYSPISRPACGRVSGAEPGSLIYALMGIVPDLYPVNPVTRPSTARRSRPAGQDDPGDARLLCEILRLHREKLAVWNPTTSRRERWGS
jgi:hypothetical protein